MAIKVVEFSSGAYKLERFMHKNQHTQGKLLNFEFWINGKLSKTGHHFCNKGVYSRVQNSIENFVLGT